MQDFSLGKMKAQEAVPEPYTLYNKEQAVSAVRPKDETLRDFEYFRSMYPGRVKSLQIAVEAVCDKMDYKESPIYDEYPDRLLVDDMLHKVQMQLRENLQEETLPSDSPVAEKEEVEIYEALPSKKSRITSVLTAEGVIPHMPYGPFVVVQEAMPQNNGYRTWEMGEEPSPLHPQNDETLQQQEMSGRRYPGGPPPWGPPPGSGGPPPWGPPPGPWRPPTPPPPPRPGGGIDLDDVLRLLLFGEMQRRRCRGRNCR